MPPQEPVGKSVDSGSGAVAAVIELPPQVVPLSTDDPEIQKTVVSDDNHSANVHSLSFIWRELLPSVSPLSNEKVQGTKTEDCRCQYSIDDRRRCRCRSRSNRVTFSSKIDIHPTIHRRDMTLKEKMKTWVTRHERIQIKDVSDNTVYLMKSGVGINLTEDDYFCPRGLEHQWNVLSAHCRQEANRSHKIALAMQRLLRRSGTDSPRMIARAYCRYTLRSRKLAYQRGLEDQHEQESIYH
jgi:hypothetical protein